MSSCVNAKPPLTIEQASVKLQQSPHEGPQLHSRAVVVINVS